MSELCTYFITVYVVLIAGPTGTNRFFWKVRIFFFQLIEYQAQVKLIYTFVFLVCDSKLRAKNWLLSTKLVLYLSCVNIIIVGCLIFNEVLHTNKIRGRKFAKIFVFEIDCYIKFIVLIHIPHWNSKRILY